MKTNFQQIKLVLSNDFFLTPKKIVPLITIIFLAIFWFFTLRGFNASYGDFDGLAKGIENESQTRGFFLWLFDVDEERLRAAPSAFLFLFTIFSLWTTHYFIILITSDQTASEVGNRYFRYLVTRCGRTELFLGRLLSALLLTIFIIVLICLAALLTFSLIDRQISWGSAFFVLQTGCWVFLHCIPFVCLCSMVSAWSGSVGISMLCSMSLAFLLPKFFTLIELQWSEVEGIESMRFFFPGSVSNSILSGNGNSLTVIVPLLYAIAFASIGCSIFRRREFP